jgi:small subunit ribosomal protein S6
MPLYEHVFMVRQDASTAQVEALTQQLKSIVEQNGGKVAKSEYWGVKSLSYRIRKNRKAHFSLLNLDAPHAALTEMERQMSLNEDVIRFLTLRVEAHEEGPSAMLRRSRERDERDRDHRDRDFRDRDRDRDRPRGVRGERPGRGEDERRGERAATEEKS